MEIKFVNPSVKMVDRTHQGKLLELAGRVCYKSEKDITNNSYKKFISIIVNQGHLSVVEHAVIYTKVTEATMAYLVRLKSTGVFIGVSFMNYVACCEALNPKHYYLALNFRSGFEILSLHGQGLFDSEPLHDILDGSPLQPNTEPVTLTIDNIESLVGRVCPHMRYESFHIVSDRAIGNEFVRHSRPAMSLSQESTRYVTYGARPVEFCVPYHLQDIVKGETTVRDTFETHCKKRRDSSMQEEDIYELSCASALDLYASYLEHKPANIARGVLPLFLKTEYFATANLQHWINFLHYRLPRAAHQDIRNVIANGMLQLLLDKYDGIYPIPRNGMQLHKFESKDKDNNKHFDISAIIDKMS